MGGAFSGLVGIVILAIDIIVIFEIVQSSREFLNKLLWTVFILLCPLIGALVYLLLADRTSYGHRYIPLPR